MSLSVSVHAPPPLPTTATMLHPGSFPLSCWPSLWKQSMNPFGFLSIISWPTLTTSPPAYEEESACSAGDQSLCTILPSLSFLRIAPLYWLFLLSLTLSASSSLWVGAQVHVQVSSILRRPCLSPGSSLTSSLSLSLPPRPSVGSRAKMFFYSPLTLSSIQALMSAFCSYWSCQGHLIALCYQCNFVSLSAAVEAAHLTPFFKTLSSLLWLSCSLLFSDGCFFRAHFLPSYSSSYCFSFPPLPPPWVFLPLFSFPHDTLLGYKFKSYFHTVVQMTSIVHMPPLQWECPRHWPSYFPSCSSSNMHQKAGDWEWLLLRSPGISFNF